MIRNSKNIKRIKLLYEEAEKTNTQSTKPEAKIETTTNIPLFKNIETTESVNTKYIQRDIIKTAIFAVFALLVLYLAHKFNLFAMIFVK